MKDWNMIYKIKALYDGGNGLNISKIAKQLGLSRNTVRKYINMEPEEISQCQKHSTRKKWLDEHEAYIKHLLTTFQELSAQKVLQKLEEKLGKLPVSARSVRRCVERLRVGAVTPQKRYYEPVVDSVAGVQCQVDPGELRNVQVGDEILHVYFVVFVLSYSRFMHVSLSFEPINTEILIQMHDAAFRYFGGMPEECVYDQMKMVVLAEEYRELTINQRFLEYATTAGFRIRACEGYDPESKGKVEAGVKYVKGNCLYGEEFVSREHITSHIESWLNTIANVRIHGTTRRVPREHFDAEEKALMRSYLTPARLLHRSSRNVACRQVDKTGLISWQGNKYSVPLEYQRAQVGVRESELSIFISDLNTGEVIATHSTCNEKGRIVKNQRHYRDNEERISALEGKIESLVGTELGQRLCALLKKANPKIYKDQLFGAQKLLNQHGPIADIHLQHILDRELLTTTRLRDLLEVFKKGEQASDCLNIAESSTTDLSCYSCLTVSRQEVFNG